MDSLLKEHFLKAMIGSKKVLMYTTATSGLPFAECMMLMRIHRLAQEESANASAGVSVTRIKDQTYVSLPAVSQQLRILEQKGFIERKVTPQDRRITLVSLTPGGRTVLQIIKQQTDIILDKIVGHVGEEIIREYIKLSQTISTSLDEIQQTAADACNTKTPCNSSTHINIVKPE